MKKADIGPKRRPLTYKEQKLVQGVAMGKSQTEAALEAYDTSTPESARALASKTLSKVNVREALEEALERHGITTDAIMKPVADGLKAVRFQEIEGKTRALPDHSIRLNASKIAAKFMGIDQGEAQGNTAINFNFGTQNYVKGKE
jgi:hypothetical protein